MLEKIKKDFLLLLLEFANELILDFHSKISEKPVE